MDTRTMHDLGEIEAAADMAPVHTAHADDGPEETTRQMRGRAKFLRKRGKVKDPSLLTYAADEIERLRAALKSAVICIEDWGAYASPYFQEKHDLKGDIARLKKVLEDEK